MTYDLRRLRLQGLIRRIGHTNRYILTPDGIKVAIFYTKLHNRLPRPLLAPALVEATRAQILEYFRASPDEYEVVFTPNATGALRLVGESYPFGPGGRYLLTFDNHNSVNGIRESPGPKALRSPTSPRPPTTFAYRRRRWTAISRLRPRPAAVPPAGVPASPPATCSPFQPSPISQASSTPWPGSPRPGTPGMTCFWTQPPSRRPIGWIFPSGTRTTCPCRFTRSSVTQPASAPSWCAGPRWPSCAARGTPAARSPSRRCGRNLPPARVSTSPPGPAGFEDGTLDYLGIPAIGIGLDHISSVGAETIHTRVMCLTGWLLDALGSLRHGNGAPVVRIYGPAGIDRRGATIAMNFFDPSGVLIDSVRIERRANVAGICLRSGCHCNPGVREVALGFSEHEMAAAFKDKDRLRYADFLQVIDGKTTGTARASLGLATTFADVYRFWEFATGFRDVPSAAVEARAAPAGVSGDQRREQ